MHSSGQRRAGPWLHALTVGAVVASFVASLVASLVAPAGVDGLSRWTGGIDLYRPGVYTAQKTLLWCTAADTQIIRNIVDRQADHTRASQSRYFSWMRLHNRYAIPVTDGVDPAGWTAGLRHYVDDRYRLVQSTSFSAALRAAVTSLRRTNLPVGLLVAHGDHAWVMTGFTATRDPAVTSSFTVTSVRVVGPLYGIQSLNGYDMAPGTKLTPDQLRRFWTAWHYSRIRMAWEGRILAIEGNATPAAGASAAPSASAAGSTSGSVSASPSVPASSTVSGSPSLSGTPSLSANPSAAQPASAAGPGPASQALTISRAASPGTSPPAMPGSAVAPRSPASSPVPPTGLIAGVVAVIAVVVVIAVRFRSIAAAVSTRARRPTRRQRSG